jgi:hypothetical protein
MRKDIRDNFCSCLTIGVKKWEMDFRFTPALKGAENGGIGLYFRCVSDPKGSRK